MMCSRYGSHVTRSLLSLLTGIEFEEPKKKSGGRLSSYPDRLSRIQKEEIILKQGKIIFLDLFRLLTEKLLESAKWNALQLCKDPFASPVLQVSMLTQNKVGSLPYGKIISELLHLMKHEHFDCIREIEETIPLEYHVL